MRFLLIVKLSAGCTFTLKDEFAVVGAADFLCLWACWVFNFSDYSFACEDTKLCLWYKVYGMAWFFFVSYYN